MSAKEKQVAQIFERTKWIIEQARQQCLLWEQHLSPKLLLNGILPPPWLSDSHHPKELNKDDIVSEVLFSQQQFGVPFSGRHCSLYSNLGAVSEGVLCPSGLPNEVHVLRKDCNTADGLSNLPDYSVNNDGCASSGPPELDCGVISPRNQMERRVSDSYHDLALSLAKVQRSKSRQRALELRCSAKASKCRSGDDNNAGICAGTFTGPASRTLQADHIEEPDLVKDFHSNIQDGSIEEPRRSDHQTQTNDNYCYSGRITRSVAQKLNSSNVASSSVVKEDGPSSNILNESFELVNGPLFINESCEVKEVNPGEHQRKEAGSSSYRKRTRRSRSSSQSRYNSEILKLDSTSGRGKGVGIHDFMQPFASVELTDINQASDQNNGSRRNIVKDSGFYNNKEGNSQGRIGSLRKSNPSPVDDFLMTGGCVNSINKSVQSLQPLISQHSQDRGEHSHKDPDFGAVKAKERLSRSGSGKACTTTGSKSQNYIEGISKSISYNFHEQSATCSESAYKKSQNVQLSELDSVEKENLAAPSSRNTRAVTTCATEGSLRPVGASKLDDGSLPVKSIYTETVGDEIVLDTQENILSGANPADNILSVENILSVAKVDAVMDVLVEKNPSCLGSRLARVSPKVGMDVVSSDFVMSVISKQLDFDDVEESSMNGNSSPDMKEGQQGISLEEEPMNSSKPVNVLDYDTSLECQVKCNSSEEMHLLETEEGLIRDKEPQMDYCANHFNEASEAGKEINAISPNKELHGVPKEFSVLTSSLMNHSSPAQVADENLSRCLSKEVMPSNFVSVSGQLENDKSSAELCDAFSAVVTENGLHKHTDEIVSNHTVGFSSGALVGEVIFDDVKHSFPQNKRRKTEIETGKFLLASTNFLEKPLDSIEQRSGSRDLSIEEDSPHALQENQHLTSNQEDDTEGPYFVSNSPTEEEQGIQQCKTSEGSSLKVRKEEKLLDGRDRSAENLLLEDKKLNSWHAQVNGEQESAQRLTCVEESNSNRRIYPGESAKLLDDSSVSPGIQRLGLIVSDDTVPEFEGFFMPTDEEQPCTTGDQVELEKMNFLSNSADYTSLGKSMFMHSPLCYSSTPYKLHNIPGICQSLPNGLLEGMNLRTSLPLNNGTTRPLSDSLPNLKVQCTPSVQTLWDRINSNFGSSGKRQSLKPELPCISEENENIDEIADTFQKGIASEGMTSSITRVPLADIIDTANPSAPALLEDKLTEEGVDFVNAESNFSGTQSRVKKKLGKHDSNRRIKNKGKENHSMSFEANGAKRTTESVGNMSSRPSRPKLSGKDSLKRGPNISVGKSSYNNIVSNITSFIPLVQQKQAAAVVTGKRDIKVKALEAAEAAKRMAEKKENERKMKKEAMRLERERLEQHNLRQLEQQKKKEEERKKKEAEMAAKKRQREDEEKKEKERKRKRLNDVKKPQQQQEPEKIHHKKEEIQIQSRAAGEGVRESKKYMDERANHQNLQLQDIRDSNMEQVSETQPLNTRDSTDDKTKQSCPAYPEAVSGGANKREVIGNSVKAAEYDDIMGENSLQEQSYEISPYKSSDDEDEDDDDIPNNKFIPSWASKHRLSLAVSSQKMDPETIFPPQSFCNIAEVLLPRKFRL